MRRLLLRGLAPSFMLITCLSASCGARTGLPPEAREEDTGLGDVLVPDAEVPDVAVPPDAPCSDVMIVGTIRITADDRFVLYVDGNMIDAPPTEWSIGHTYSVALHRLPSVRNSIAIRGTNLQNTNGPDRGVIADLSFDAGGGKVHVVTDRTWRVATTLVAGWSNASFDPSGWRFATVEGPNGMKPWGAVIGPSSADWLWSYDSNLPANAKPVNETIYLRRDFYIDASGHPSDTPMGCP